MENIVEVFNLSKKYGLVTAVNNVSFSIEKGKFFSLLGPSGCGKTTILRIIGGFIEPDTGTVKIGGRDMAGLPPNKRSTSMVFQNLALFPHMNVTENIIYGLKKRRAPSETVSKKLERILGVIDLDGLQNRRINELSGGQRQRVALARSLIIEPEILLLDEPLASLDKKLRVSMRNELKEIQKNTGTTFLFVTHDQGEALNMSDTLAVMNGGEIIQLGAPDLIYNNPSNYFVADFIGAGNFIEVLRTQKYEGLVKITLKTGTEILLENSASSGFSGFEQKNPANGSRKQYFFIRPERIKFSTEAQNGSGPVLKQSGKSSRQLQSSEGFDRYNRFEAAVVSKIFEGPDIRLIAYAGGLGKIVLEAKNETGLEGIETGRKIIISWNIKDGVIFSE